MQINSILLYGKHSNKYHPFWKNKRVEPIIDCIALVGEQSYDDQKYYIDILEKMCSNDIEMCTKQVRKNRLVTYLAVHPLNEKMCWSVG